LKRKIFIPEEMTKGYSRREFLRMLEIAGIGVTIGATGILAGCSEKVDPLAGAKEVITRCGFCGAD
jgi:hypothetical protein